MGGTPITSAARGEVYRAKTRKGVPGRGKQVHTQRHTHKSKRVKLLDVLDLELDKQGFES